MNTLNKLRALRDWFEVAKLFPQITEAMAAEIEGACAAGVTAIEQRDKLLSALNQVLTILRDLDCPLDVRVTMAHDVAHENVAAIVKADISSGLRCWAQGRE
jgi:hypothetical protein